MSTAFSTKETNTAPTPTRNISKQQLIDLRDVLKGPPLTNRSVLIPFGTKAFLPGTLKPELSSIIQKHEEERCITSGPKSPNNKCKDYQLQQLSHFAMQSKQSINDIAKAHELVRLNLTSRASVSVGETDSHCDNSQMMNRNEAIQSLQQEIDSTSVSKTVKPLQYTKKQKFQVISDGATNTIKNSQSAALPYMEIREELDGNGNVITSEAKNVTNHLQYLQMQSNEVESTPVSSNSVSDIENVNIDDDSNEQQQRIVSDEEYKSISQRLEELILLEEQHKQPQNTLLTTSTTKPTIRKSSTKSGWAKGFLNSSSKTATNKKQSTATSSTIQKDKYDVLQQPVPTTKPTESLQTNQSKHDINQNSDDNTKKSVSFIEDRNSVQVIPRIGQRSISSMTPPSFNISSPPRTSYDSSNRSDTTAFLSQVIEKKTNNRRRNAATPPNRSVIPPPTVQQTENKSHVTASVTATSTTCPPSTEIPTPAKLSRFAQERLLLRQNQQQKHMETSR